jgi:GGDEF domain-containing protein
VLLVTVNTPLRFDEDIGAGGRAALNAMPAFATAFALGRYVVARYGGEEFVVLLPVTMPEGAADRAMSEAKRRGKDGIFVPEG